MRWIGVIALAGLVALTIGFVVNGVVTGRIEFLGKRRATRSASPFRFTLWLLIASIWCAAIFALALPLIFF